MNDVKITKCPVCGTDNCQKWVSDPHKCDTRYGLNCVRCGWFEMPASVIDDIPGETKVTPEQRAAVSHYIRCHNDGNNNTNKSYLCIDYPTWENLLKTKTLPSVLEQVDNFIKLLGTSAPYSGLCGIVHHPGFADFVDDIWRFLGDKNRCKFVWLDSEISGIIGAFDNSDALVNIRQICQNENLIEFVYHRAAAFGISLNGSNIVCGMYKLTYKGWLRFNSMAKNPMGKKAFIAMAFGNKAHAKEIDKWLKPYIEEHTHAKFELERVDDIPGIGLIDDKIRNDIKTGHFVIAEISDQNKGVYFEAGYAEGIGKPVIYICKESVFQEAEELKKKSKDERKNKEKIIHFDIEHQNIIRWKDRKDNEFLRQLVECINLHVPMPS